MEERIILPAYEAMDARDRQAQRGFVLRLASGERMYLNYPDVHLKRLSPDQTVLAVFCYSLNIVMRGRCLGEIADALQGQYVAWLQEFDVARWTPLADPQAPFIERIEIYAKRDETSPQPDDKAQGQAETRARH